MGRIGKRVQKKNPEENRDGETSNPNSASSSSSSALSPNLQGHPQNDPTDNFNIHKIEGGNTSRKINRGESSSYSEEVETDPGQGQGQGQNEGQESTDKGEGPIDNLPPEMLTLILKYVDTRSLVKCRLVSRQWSSISTAIFRSRLPVIPIWFLWEDETFSQKDGRSLKEFVQCAKTSTPENCPFTHFWFSNHGSACFDDKDFRDFLSLFSTRRLKHLKLDSTYSTAHFPVLVKKLGRFLLNDVPQLEELHLELSADWLSLEKIEFKQVPLFPTNTNTNSNPDNPPLPVKFQLPNLKLLHLETWTISPHVQICKDLLNAAVNLIRIKTSVMRPENFEFFHSLGKVQLLKDVVLCFNDNFVGDIKKEEFQLQFKNWSLPENVFSLVNLDKLELLNNMEMREFDEVSLGQASKLVSTLLESSKDSLRDFEIGAFPFLAHLQLPVFTRLRKLEIHASDDHQIFPSGTRTKCIFPAVDSLELYVENWPLAFPQPDSIPGLTGVKTLIVKEWNFKPEQAEIAVFILAQLCPNLKKLGIQKSHEAWDPPQLNFVEVGRAIWTLMKDLESLEVDVDLDKPENNPVALDSCFSGVLHDTCLHLLKLTQAKQFLEENGIPVEIPKSKLKAERDYPSILNLKNLRNLTVNPYSGKNLLDKKEFSNKLTWISHELAFKLMPNLELNEGDF